MLTTQFRGAQGTRCMRARTHYAHVFVFGLGGNLSSEAEDPLVAKTGNNSVTCIDTPWPTHAGVVGGGRGMVANHPSLCSRRLRIRWAYLQRLSIDKHARKTQRMQARAKRAQGRTRTGRELGAASCKRGARGRVINQHEEGRNQKRRGEDKTAKKPTR